MIDEVQRRPDLMPLLRVLLDRDPLPARFLLLGSASPELIRGGAESLAGRIEFVQMSGFAPDEVGTAHSQQLWLRGGFPLSYLADNDHDSLKWRQAFLQAFLERDLRMLGIDLPPVTLRRFLTMIAHSHGQTWNASEIGRSMDLAHTTVKRYLDVLCGALLLRALPPWFENVGKRLVKAPKIYIRDSGLLHALLGLETVPQLESHPRLGASWEGFAIEQVLECSAGDTHAYFWATHGGAELDLCLMTGSQRVGVEFKYTSYPSVTRSMTTAYRDLRLDHVYLVYPGKETFLLNNDVTAISLDAIRDRVRSRKS